MQSLRQAVEAWDNLKRPYQQALASGRLATLLLAWAERKTLSQAGAQRARAEADTLLQETATTYERLPIPTGLQAVQALRASARLDAQHKRRTTLQVHHPLLGLTRRETQVLIQLAAGQSNKEIAAALMLSERTVEVHVAHILSKLGCDTRTQAAAYAINKGWVKNQVLF
jgi:DNA-binding NarL/FixJ family response regulator